MNDQRGDRPAGGRLARAWIPAILMLVPQLSLASLNPAEPLHRFTQQNWQLEQGLPQNSILAIAQTANGYLWVGTEEGLARYDGVRFVTFDVANSVLRSSLIRALLVDHHGTLWIGTQNGGLAKFQNGQFQLVEIPGYSPELSISSISEDHTGALWIGTDDSGLIRMGGPEGNRSFGVEDGLVDGSILGTNEGKDGTLWVVTRKGLAKLRNNRFIRMGKSEGLASDNVRAVKVDHEGSVWVGTAAGLNRIQSGTIATFTTRDGLASNEIDSINEDGAHSVWIGTRSGLTRFAQGKLSSLTGDPVVSGSDIGCIFEDRQGDLWLGTGGHGLISLKEGVFSTLTTEDGLARGSILPIFEDREGNLWIGSEHGLTKRTKSGTKQFTTKDGLYDDFIFSITQDLTGAMWIGTRSGISRIVGDKVFAFMESASRTPAMALFTDKAGRVWMGNRGGLKCYDGHTITSYTSKNGLADDLVTSIQEDSTGTIWLGTSAGLSRFSDGKFRNYSTVDGLTGNFILAIYCDRSNVLWLATTKGLGRYRGGQFTSFSRLGRPLEGLMISAVLEDHNGYLWLSSNRGIVKVSKRQLNQYADGNHAQEVDTFSFDTTDGMKSRECNGGFQPAGWVGRDGKLYFPTVAGVAVTDPGKPPKPRGGNLVIERLVVNGAQYSPNNAAVVPAGPGRLEIQFSSPDLYFQNKVQFRYLLESFDREWVDAETRRTAYYTNIPYGEYRFRVQSGVNGVWNDNLVSQPLTLKPHFYQTQPFFFFAAIALITAAAAVYRVRMEQNASRELRLRELVNERTFALRESEAQLRQSRDELEVRVIERTKELTEANKSLEEEIHTRRETEELLMVAKEAAEAANHAKGEFLTNMSHELRTPINGILGMVDITLSTDLNEEQTEYLGLAKTSADALLTIVNDILDFSQIENRKMHIDRLPFQLRKIVEEVFGSMQVLARNKGLSPFVTIHPDIPEEVVGDGLRMKQVLMSLLDNAVKFTSQGSITLTASPGELSEGHMMVHFAVQDTGIGIAPEKIKTIFEAFSQADTSSTRRYGGTGLGLTISNQLAKLLDGELWVESTVGVGSIFHFTARVQVAPESDRPSPSSHYDASITV